MKLYYSPGTISIAVAIALNEAGLEYETVLVDFSTGEQTKPNYHKVNPKGRVPALDIGGKVITETGALLEFVAQLAPGAGLVPADPVDAAHMRGAMYYLASTMHVNHAHRMRGSRWADQKSSWDDMAAKVAQTMTASCEYVTEHCLRGPYIMGDAVSLADPYLFVICRWLASDGVDVERFEKIGLFMEAMHSRDSVQKAIADGMLP